MSLPLIEVTVTGKSQEKPDIAVFELQRPDGAPLPAFEAGAHIDVHLAEGLIRQYSLCNAPSETHRYRIGVLRTRDSRGGSRTLHDTVGLGDKLIIGAPRNLFALDVDAPHALLLAGGIGVTPLLAMAEQLSHDDRAFALHYWTRSRESTAFAAHLAQARYAPCVHHHYDDDPATTLDIAELIRHAPANSHAYTCGPQGFMDSVLSLAHEAGWSASRLHSESFGGLPVSQGDRSFEVLLARSGRVITVAPDQTVVQALNGAGVIIPTACEQGICGTCLTRVLAGMPDHRDQYLTPEEQAAGDQFLPCCSRSLTPRLELDL